jgi:hypothetical protein
VSTSKLPNAFSASPKKKPMSSPKESTQFMDLLREKVMMDSKGSPHRSTLLRFNIPEGENNPSKSSRAFSEANTLKSVSNDRVFWSREKIVEVREKFKEIKDIINRKTEDKFYELDQAISEGNEEKVLSTMRDHIFKFFWGNELKKRNVLINILLANQPEILQKVLADEFYKFDEFYVFRYIKQILGNRTNNDLRDVEQAYLVLNNIINCDLYDKRLHKLLAWFLGNLNNYDSFRLLISKHKEFDEEKLQYNNFETKEDIDDYSSNSSNYYVILSDCLKNGLEELAM